MTFEFAGGGFLEDGEAEGFGVGDGEGLEKFRRVYRLGRGGAFHRLAAGGASGEVGFARVLPMVKALAAEAAGTGGGDVAVDGHGRKGVGSGY